MDGITEKQAYGVEKELIKHYKSNYDKYGYNKSIGGRYSNEGVIGKKRKSPNYKRKMPKGGKSYRAKRIVQFDIKGNKKKVWSCGVHAAEKLGLKTTTGISNCCNFKQITAHGYIWLFETEQWRINEKLKQLNNTNEMSVKKRSENIAKAVTKAR